MNESVLRALLRLFALVTEASDEKAIALAKQQVRAYLQHKIAEPQLEVYLAEFEEYLLLFTRPAKRQGEKKARKASTLGSVKVIMVCEKINENLTRQEKITVLVRLLEFVHKGGQISFREQNFLETLSRIFNIDSESYALIHHFITSHTDPHEGLIYIGDDAADARCIQRPGLSGKIQVLLLGGTSLAYAKYHGPDAVYINNHLAEPDTVYLLFDGSAITGAHWSPVHLGEILRKRYSGNFVHDIHFSAEDISYRFPGGAFGLHSLQIEAASGTLVGIMGASGAGKSTLLNVLNGNLSPTTGSVKVNGIDVREKSAKQLIGYVPQDDLLVEELTVFENLYLSGQLCLSALSESELKNRIETLLQRIDLIEARDLRVGSVLDKRISGGQRKRLNIALELLREPAVLFVDEPTSGLSSQDSEVVMQLLKALTLKGQLIFVVIHQPSGHLYRLLDQLILLDKGGYPVYQGHAMEAPAWFRKQAGHVQEPGESNRVSAQIDPDEMLRIIEARQVDVQGRQTAERMQSPEEWYALYQAERTDPSAGKTANAATKPVVYHTPSAWRQFRVFLQRNLIAKVRNQTFVALALLEIPILAFVLGFFTRYAAGNAEDASAYVFFLNKNLPAFLFMSIVVAIFVGMQISAEEIIRDRKILKRESFLSLSRWSYLNSKVLYLLLLSAWQAILLVVIGNYWLEIKGMYVPFFAVLFPTFVFANLVGLNISQAFRSVVTIYILVPFLVVPQLLLSGVIVNFDTLQSPKNQGKETPVVADLMVSRWAYEALAVAQFKENDYQRHFFDETLLKNEALYQFSFRMPKLQNINQRCKLSLRDSTQSSDQKTRLRLLKREVSVTNAQFKLKFDRVEYLVPGRYDMLTADLLSAWLNEIERQFRVAWEKADDKVRQIQSELATRRNLPNLEPLKNAHQNQKLEEHLTNKHELYKIRVVDDVLVNKSSSIFKRPDHPLGRAHFYAPYKLWMGQRIDTLWFNTGVIWIFNLLLYVMLVNNTPLRLRRVFQGLKGRSI